MRGTLYTISSKLNAPHREVHLNRPVTRSELESAVGGDLDIIPGFEIGSSHGTKETVAFCNRHAEYQRQPHNGWASILWGISRREEKAQGMAFNLAGDVVVVSGDDEFMASLESDAFPLLSTVAPEMDYALPQRASQAKAIVEVA